MIKKLESAVSGIKEKFAQLSINKPKLQSWLQGYYLPKLWPWYYTPPQKDLVHGKMTNNALKYASDVKYRRPPYSAGYSDDKKDVNFTSPMPMVADHPVLYNRPVKKTRRCQYLDMEPYMKTREKALKYLHSDSYYVQNMFYDNIKTEAPFLCPQFVSSMEDKVAEYTPTSNRAPTSK